MMTNIKKAVSKIQKAKDTIASVTKAKKVKVDAQLPTSQKATPTISKISAEERRNMIANIAYFKAERRNFAPGCENDDWLAAEAEVNALPMI